MNNFKPNDKVFWVYEQCNTRSSFVRNIPAILKQKKRDKWLIDTYCPDTYEKKELLVDQKNIIKNG